VSVWPKGRVVEAVADEIWDAVSDRNDDVLRPARKRAKQAVSNDEDTSTEDKV
jgi:hypothetical protein